MFPSLYAILDVNLSGPSISKLAVSLAESGVQLIQIRDKRGEARKLIAETRKILEVLSPRGVRLIVNDRPDVAAISGAGGVHVGQGDLPVEEARKICRPPSWVGVSTHNLAQLREADATSADYIAVGPVFPTATKENPDPVVGIDFLQAARRLTRKPIVAIGGITLDSVSEVFRAGADSVAVIRDLVSAENPAMQAKEYLAIGARVRSTRGDQSIGRE